MSFKNNFDLLEKFSNNSKKDKISALILMITLCLLALSIVYLVLEIYKKNEKIKEQTEEIKEQIKKIKQQEIDIDRAADVIDSLNTGIIVCQSSLENTVKNMDNSIELLNQQLTTSENSSNNSKTAKVQNNKNINNDRISPKVGSSKTVSSSAKSSIDNITNTKRKYPQVYIQYMPEFGNLEKSVAQSLRNTRKYRVWASEKIADINFDHQVRYFNDEDHTIANTIAETIKQNNSINISVVKIENMKAPIGQIEIWLGETKKLNEIDVIQRNESIINKFNLEKK